jgi:crossover junction endodeoxyribonuclease RuvC
MRALGIDPGTATTGYGIVDYLTGKEKLVHYGTIRTAAGVDMPIRLYQIKRELDRLLEEYQPDVVAVEELFYNRNSKTVITVAQSRGVVLMTAAAAGLPIAEYTPLQVKQSVVGYGNADKRQVQLMVQRILSMKDIPRPDDAADALAIAVCCLHSYRLSRYIKDGNL